MKKILKTTTKIAKTLILLAILLFATILMFMGDGQIAQLDNNFFFFKVLFIKSIGFFTLAISATIIMWLWQPIPKQQILQ